MVISPIKPILKFTLYNCMQFISAHFVSKASSFSPPKGGAQTGDEKS